jgi:PAS domain S-box-containing protein
MIRRWSIRAQLLGLACAIALPLAGLLAWNLYASARYEAQRAREQMLSLARVTAADAARFLGQAHNILTGLAGRPAVRALDPARCDPVLKDFLDLAPRFANVATMRLDGTVICSGAPLARPARMDPSKMLDLLRGSGELTVGQLTPETITGRWAIPVGLPLLDERGRVTGAVGLAIDLVGFKPPPVVTGLPEKALTGIVASDGTILAHSREPGRFVGTKAGAGRVAVREKTGTAEVTGLDGIPRIQGFVPVPGTDWVAVASLPADAVYAGLRTRIAASAALALVVFGFAGWLTAWLSRAVSEPIRALAGTAARVAARDPEARAVGGGAAEIADVAAQFNVMLDERARADAALLAAARRSSEILESMSDGFVALDRDWRYTYVNRAASEMFGRSAESLIGRIYHEEYPEAVGTPFERAYREAMEKRVPVMLEERYAPWERWFENRVYPTPEGISIFFHEITERKRAEDALRESEAKLRELIDGLGPEMFVGLTTPQGVLLEANRPALAAGGLSREDVIGKPLADTWWLSWSAEVQHRMREAIARAAAGEASRYDEQMRVAGGQLVWIDFSLHPVRDAAGRVAFLVPSARVIEERKQAEQALRESALQLQMAARAGNVGLWDWDLRTDAVFFSPEWKRQLGYEEHEIPNAFSEWQSRVHPEDLERSLRTVREFIERPWPGYSLEFRMRHKNGSWRWILAQGSLEHDAQGNAIRMLGTHIDITERKKIETDLLEQRRHLRAVTDNLPGLAGRVDRDLRYLYASAGYRRFGREPHEIVGRTIAEVIGEEAFRRAEPYVRRALAGERVTFENEVVSEGGRTSWGWTTFVPDLGPQRAVRGFFIVALDITERKRAENDLREAHERLQRISRQLLEVQERERAAVARELHDEIGQSLTALKLGIEALARRLKGAPAEKLSEFLGVVERSLAQTRDLTLALRPPQLDQLGLAAALRDAADRLAAQVGFTVQFAADAEPARLDPSLATAAYRVAQEALTNAARHAGARRVAVELRVLGEELLLAVSDDGRGYDLDAARARALGGASMGLLGMEERAELAGGSLRIITRPGQGTRVEAAFPLPASRARRSA